MTIYAKGLTKQYKKIGKYLFNVDCITQVRKDEWVADSWTIDSKYIAQRKKKMRTRNELTR